MSYFFDYIVLVSTLYLVLSIFVYLYYVYFFTRRHRRSTNLNGRNICLLVAHPDDEVMFFGPAVRELSSSNRMHVLCMTQGDFYGAGNRRINEMSESCRNLFGSGLVDLKVVNEPEKLPDSPIVQWDRSLAIDIVDSYIRSKSIDTVITFDRHGISTHPNHCELFRVCKELERRNKSDELNMLYLETVNRARKYSFLFDILPSLIFSDEHQLLFISKPSDFLITFDSMMKHRSQLINAKNILFDDYEGSEFEYGSDNNNESSAAATGKKLAKGDEVSTRPQTSSSGSGTGSSSKGSLPPKSSFSEALSKEEGKVRAMHFMSMNAYAKHIKLVNDYLMYYSGGRSLKEVFARDTSKDRTDLDVIREEMRFIWDDDEPVDTWEKRLAKKYYDKLFKEYCICDLTYYTLNKIAMRWRVEKEVLTGKGQFICGEKKCNTREGLKTWEVNFGYVEHGEKKNALVKLRLCPDCSTKLNFHHKKKEYIKPAKRKKDIEEAENKRKTAVVEESSSSDESSKREEEEESSKSEHHAKKKLKKEPGEQLESKSNEEESSGNMIIIKGDDSLWKSSEKAAAAANLADSAKSRETEFEDYLEDLFF